MAIFCKASSVIRPGDGGVAFTLRIFTELFRRFFLFRRRHLQIRRYTGGQYSYFYIFQELIATKNKTNHIMCKFVTIKKVIENNDTYDIEFEEFNKDNTVKGESKQKTGIRTALQKAWFKKKEKGAPSQGKRVLKKNVTTQTTEINFGISFLKPSMILKGMINMNC